MYVCIGDGSCTWRDINENSLFHFNPRPRKGLLAMNIIPGLKALAGKFGATGAA